MTKYFRNPIVSLVIFSRILAAIYILVDPLWGLVLSVIFDWLDAYFLQTWAGMRWGEYQILDKNIDWIGYIFMLLSAAKYGAFWLLLPFLAYRLIGYLVFIKSHNQKIFLLFPNLFEIFFVWFVVFQYLSIKPGIAVLVFLLVFAEVREFFLHLFWPAYLRKNGQPGIFRIFGMRKKVNW